MRDQKLEGLFLLVDAAGPLVQVGLWREGSWVAWQASREEAGRSLFAGASDIFRDQQISLTDLNGFFFGEGPGSMLGIRMAAMAVRGWQSLLDAPLPVFSYSSHELLARVLLARSTPTPFHVISDARRNRWNVTSVIQPNDIAPLRRLTEEEMRGLPDPLYRMEETIRNEPPVAIAKLVPYNLEKEAERFLEPGLLRPTSAPDVLTQESPEYKKWTAERHR